MARTYLATVTRMDAAGNPYTGFDHVELTPDQDQPVDELVNAFKALLRERFQPTYYALVASGLDEGSANEIICEALDEVIEDGWDD